MRKYFSFPLYFNDNKPIENISIGRQNAVEEFENKILDKEYKYIRNRCLCGNEDKDIELSQKDRFGISVKFLLCKNCSIIRTDIKLDEYSLSNFYAKYYRKIYGNNLASIEEEFRGQVAKGMRYKNILDKYILFDTINSIFDFGCGTGGVLIPFKYKNRLLCGADYNYDRLEYGNKKGLQLYHADKEIMKISKNSYDLVILSHVMEHFSNPLVELNNVFELVSENGYIFIVVPSPMYIGKSPAITYKFFQNVHLYNYNKKYLIDFFKCLGMEIIYINEICECILKKPKNWNRNDLDVYNNDSLTNYYKIILIHFKKVIFLNDILKISSIRLQMIKILELLQIKNFIKKILGRL